jgi:IS30 family transposase
MESAALIGIDKCSAQDWDKCISQITGGRRYPDGRVVRYRQAAILANVKTPRNAYTRGTPADLMRLEALVDARFLSLLEREQIHDLSRRGESMRAIGRALGRSPSTISRLSSLCGTSPCRITPTATSCTQAGIHGRLARLRRAEASYEVVT